MANETTPITQSEALGRITKQVQTEQGVLDRAANQDFIQAAAQAKFGRPASAEELQQTGTNEFALGGAKVSDVLGKFGLDIPTAAPDAAPITEEPTELPEEKVTEKIEDAPTSEETITKTTPEGDQTTLKTEPTEDEVNIEKQLTEVSNQTTTLVENFNTQIDNYSKTLSNRAKNLINNIKSQFDVRRREQERLNRAVLGGTTTRGFVSGRARFASQIQADIISNEESNGVARLASLDSQEQALIMEAQSDLDSKEFSLLSKKFDNIINLQKQKEATLVKINQMANENTRLTMEKARHELDKQQFALSVEQAIASEERAERTQAIAEEKFLQDNAKEIAASLGSQLVDLDGNNEIIKPDRASIEAIAEANGISPSVLASQINERIDELRKVQRDDRKVMLDEVKFDEQIRQNELRNKLERQRLAISAGNLSVSRAREARAAAEKEEGLKFKFDESDRNRLISSGFSTDDVSNVQDRLRAGETIDEIFADSEASEEQISTIKSTLSGITPTQEIKLAEEPEIEEPSASERRQIAADRFSEFEDAFGGVIIPTKYDNEGRVIATKKISEDDAVNLLVKETGIPRKEAEEMIDSLE